MDALIQERIGIVWPLTKEIASLSPKHDVERRLQRHITVPYQTRMLILSPW